MIALTAYILLGTEFLIRFLKDKPFKRPYNETLRGTFKLDKNMKMMIGAMAFASTCLYIRYVYSGIIAVKRLSSAFSSRSIYRVIELTNGWTGRIITTEIYFSACFRS